MEINKLKGERERERCGMCKECERERGGHENEIEFYESQICLSYGDFSNINSARRNALIIKTISTVINVLSFDGYKKPRRDGKQKKKEWKQICVARLI